MLHTAGLRAGSRHRRYREGYTPGRPTASISGFKFKVLVTAGVASAVVKRWLWLGFAVADDGLLVDYCFSLVAVCRPPVLAGHLLFVGGR